MAQSPIYLREDQAIIQAGATGTYGGVSLAQLPTIYSWAALEGGVLEAASVFTRPGGMLPGRQLGGPSERTDVTIRRQMTPELQVWVVPLELGCGTAAAYATYTLLDRNKNPTGQTVSMTGILKSVVRMNFDANNNAAGFLGLVIALDQEATAS